MVDVDFLFYVGQPFTTEPADHKGKSNDNGSKYPDAVGEVILGLSLILVYRRL